jgi:hypothetical protein
MISIKFIQTIIWNERSEKTLGIGEFVIGSAIY